MVVYSRVEVAERMDTEEFFRDAPEDRKAELIDGVMIMPSPPLTIHEQLFSFLFRLLGGYTEELGLGEIFGSRTAVALDANNAPEPDILFVSADRRHIIQEKGVMGAPDLVIEILSAGTVRYDRGAKFDTYGGAKFDAYERAGVHELWLIDPYGPAGTEFYRLEGGRFQPFIPDADGILRSASVNGFWIDVNWLWPRERFVAVSQALTQILS